MSSNIREFTAQDAGQQELTWSVPITGPSPATPFWVNVQCFNIPTDGMLGFSVTCQSQGVQPVNVPIQHITNPNEMLGVQVTGWPAGAQGEVTVYYQPGATPPPSGASIQVSVTVPAV